MTDPVRVVFFARLAKDAVIAKLKQIPGIDFVATEDVQEMLRALKGAQVLVTPDVRGEESRLLADALCAPGRTLRWVQCLSAGYESLVRHGFPQDMVLTNQGGAVAPAVAEQAFALMLALVRHLYESIPAKARHEWIPDMSARASVLEGRTLAVVGFGHAGRAIARRARAFDMTVLGVSRSGNPDPLADEMHPASALREVLARSDAIVIAASHTPETHHLIGAKEFAVCKSDAILVNVARGPLVDPTALKAALDGKTIAGAGIDVTEPEPLPADHPLWDCANLIITPHHAGGGSTRSRQRILNVLAENMDRFRLGQPLLHVVQT
jgi:phosphoglycerate dehydrogenase-like enzyme